MRYVSTRHIIMPARHCQGVFVKSKDGTAQIRNLCYDLETEWMPADRQRREGKIELVLSGGVVGDVVFFEEGAFGHWFEGPWLLVVRAV